jgi:hypothetical protein
LEPGTTRGESADDEATYRILPLKDGAYGVEVAIPECSPTRVTSFSTEVAAQEWIAEHKRKFRAGIHIGGYVSQVGGKPAAVKSGDAMLEPGGGAKPGRATEGKTGRMNPTGGPALGDLRRDAHKRRSETGRQMQMEKAQAKRDVYDKRSRDIAEARQNELEPDAAKTARLRTRRLAKNAAERLRHRRRNQRPHALLELADGNGQ